MQWLSRTDSSPCRRPANSAAQLFLAQKVLSSIISQQYHIPFQSCTLRTLIEALHLLQIHFGYSPFFNRRPPRWRHVMTANSFLCSATC